MKKFLFVLFATMSLISCEDTQTNEVALQAKVDDRLYTSTDARAALNEDGTLTIQGFNDEESMTIQLSRLGEGNFTIGEGSSNYAVYEDIEFEVRTNSIKIISIIKTKESTGVEMEALTAVSSAALTIYDMCKAVDKTMSIGEINLVEKVGGKSDHATEYRPQVGVITISDSVSSGKNEDRSGPLLVSGFSDSGCSVEHKKVLPDGSDEFSSTIQNWIKDGVELIITTGGTGLGPRDLTIQTLEGIFDSKLPGVEQALHAYGRGKVKTAMLSRLTAGVVDGAIVICLPGSTGAVKDALNVLIPTIFHTFHMMKGEKH